jgi:hypothetical protein
LPFWIYDYLVSLTDNLAAIQQRIKAACDRVDREPNSVALLAVTKGHPPETVRAATDLGLVLFGENKVQEAKAKIPLSPGKARWHFIGHLQSNKCREAVELFEMVQSVDSLSLAQELHKRADAIGKTMPVLLEVNVAGEASKFGYKPDRLLAELSDLNSLRRLEIHGLMTVPPYVTDPENARPHFKRLRELKRECEQQLGVPLPHLSMGMSGDFEIAIEEGASIIRVGTALFGARSRSKQPE